MQKTLCSKVGAHIGFKGVGMKLSNLFEGLREYDLENLVDSTISVDEYKSKIDDIQAIVVMFLVNDRDPAEDLRNYIEKSATSLLDSEVGDTPEKDGRYRVFVEFNRNSNFPKELIYTLKTLTTLVDIDLEKWKFLTYKDQGPFPVTQDNIRRYVNLTQQASENK